VTDSRIDDGSSTARGLTGLFVALGLAVVSRFSFVHAQSFTMDEVAELSIAKGSIDQIVRTVDGFPPLYHLVLHGWLEIFGTDAGARWLSVLFGVLTLLCVWKLARILVGPRGAGWAATIFSVLPFHIWYSQEARAYSLYILLAALSLWLFFRARATNGWADWALFVAAGTAGMYAHYFFAILLGTLAICLLVEGRNETSSRRAWISLAVLAALCVPDLWLLRIDLTFQPTPHAGKPAFGPTGFGYTYFSFVSGYTIGPSMRELHTIGATEALRELMPWLPIVGLAVGYLAWSVVRAPAGGVALRPLLILCLVPVIMLGMLTRLGHIGYNVRYGSWVVVPVVVFLGAGVAQSIKRWEGKLALALVVAIFALARWNRVTLDRYREEDSRALAGFLQKQGLASRNVLVTAGYMAPSVSYYLDGDWTVGPVPGVSSEGDGLDEAVAVILAAEQAGTDIWLVYARPFHGDPGGLLLDRLQSAASRAERFAGIELYLVDRGKL
jgi:hypothetical protein